MQDRKQVEFLYDFGSPNAYMVDQILPKIAARHGYRITYRPVLLGGIFNATGNQSPALAGVKGKMAYLRQEMDRFAPRHGIAFTFNPHFPIHSVALMRGALVAQDQPWEALYRQTMFRHCWAEGTDMSNPDTIMTVLKEQGLPAEQILKATQSPEIKAALYAATDSVVARGAFGVPTIFAGSEMFFGKDSLIDLELHLKASA